MAVRIRLTRVGATKQPTYRFVVSDSRNARDGRSIDTLGHYNPRTNPIEINVDENKAKDWMSRGAKPSDTVARLFRRVGVLPEESAPVRTTKAAPKQIALLCPSYQSLGGKRSGSHCECSSFDRRRPRCNF